MQRSKLEQASWVAGIISAVIAIYALFSVPSPSPVTSAAAASNSTQIRSTEVIPKDVEVSQRSPSIATGVCDTKKNLESNLELALSIFYAEERDKALTRLMDSALCTEDFELLGRIAGAIFYGEPRDSAYEKVIDLALSKGQIQIAKKFSDSMFYAGPRDNAKQKILAAAIRSRGE